MNDNDKKEFLDKKIKDDAYYTKEKLPKLYFKSSINEMDQVNCKHENFIKSLGIPQSNREYWIMTEIFVYLHKGSDECNCFKNKPKT